MKEDVHRHHVAKSSPPSTSSNTESVPSTVGTQDRLVSLTATQNAIFKVMSYSLTIPHFLFSHSVDTTLLTSRRKHFNRNAALLNAQLPILTALPFIMMALSHTFIQFPLLNSHLHTESNASKPHVVLNALHNFGIAVDTAWPSGKRRQGRAESLYQLSRCRDRAVVSPFWPNHPWSRHCELRASVNE